MVKTLLKVLVSEQIDQIEKRPQMGLVVNRAQAADKFHRIQLLHTEGHRILQADQAHADSDTALLHPFVGNRESGRQDDVGTVFFNVGDHGINVARLNVSHIQQDFSGSAHCLLPVSAFHIKHDSGVRQQFMEIRRLGFRFRVHGLIKIFSHDLPDFPDQLRSGIGNRFPDDRIQLFQKALSRDLMLLSADREIPAVPQAVDLITHPDIIFVA